MSAGKKERTMDEKTFLLLTIFIPRNATKGYRDYGMGGVFWDFDGPTSDLSKGLCDAIEAHLLGLDL